MKDHLESKKYSTRKCSKQKLKGTESTSFLSIVKSKDLREEFALAYTKFCTLADIPLHKTNKMQPFLQKSCRQAGSRPQVSTLCKVYVSLLFAKYYSALVEVFKNQPVRITAEEPTDVREYTECKASVHGKPYLIGVVHMEACNQCTFSQAITESVTNIGIEFGHITAVVSDSAAYCNSHTWKFYQQSFLIMSMSLALHTL